MLARRCENVKLTTKGRYAVTAMLDLALHQADGSVSLLEISKRQEISQSYLEQLFLKLRRQQLVTSLRGANGGYHIERPLNEITVGDIITAIEDNIDATQCAGSENCRGGARCLTHELWTDLNKTVDNFLQSISLADLLSKTKASSEQLIHWQRHEKNSEEHTHE